jgi:hypothetical protein
VFHEWRHTFKFALVEPPPVTMLLRPAFHGRDRREQGSGAPGNDADVEDIGAYFPHQASFVPAAALQAAADKILCARQ